MQGGTETCREETYRQAQRHGEDTQAGPQAWRREMTVADIPDHVVTHKLQRCQFFQALVIEGGKRSTSTDFGTWLTSLWHRPSFERIFFFFRVQVRDGGCPFLVAGPDTVQLGVSTCTGQRVHILVPSFRVSVMGILPDVDDQLLGDPVKFK